MGLPASLMHIPYVGTQEALFNDRRRPTHENALAKLFANVKVCKFSLNDLKQMLHTIGRT